jgi:hypothetical protein
MAHTCPRCKTPCLCHDDVEDVRPGAPLVAASWCDHCWPKRVERANAHTPTATHNIRGFLEHLQALCEDYKMALVPQARLRVQCLTEKEHPAMAWQVLRRPGEDDWVLLDTFIEREEYDRDGAHRGPLGEDG